MARQKSEITALAEAYRDSPLAGLAFRVANGEKAAEFPDLVTEDDRWWKIRVLIHDNVNRIKNPVVKDMLNLVIFGTPEDLKIAMERLS